MKTMMDRNDNKNRNDDEWKQWWIKRMVDGEWK